MTYQNRCIVFPQKNQVELIEEPINDDNLAPSEVLVQTEVTLISAGTELSFFTGTGERESSQFPFRPGYASIGRLLRIGEAISDFREGQRVFLSGKHARYVRYRHDQGHQWGHLFPVPEQLAAEDAVMGCLAQIAYSAPLMTERQLHDTVAVFGLGLIGNFAAQLYQLSGARVIGLDPLPARGELARKCGVRETLTVPSAEQVQAILDLTADQGAHVTVDAVGHSAVIQSCVLATRRFGQVILLGTPRADFESNITPALRKVHEEGLIIRGAHMWRLPTKTTRETPRSVEWAYAMIFELIQQGRLIVPPLRSHLIRPEEAPQTYHGLLEDRDHYWGAVIDWRHG